MPVFWEVEVLVNSSNGSTMHAQRNLNNYMEETEGSVKMLNVKVQDSKPFWGGFLETIRNL